MTQNQFLFIDDTRFLGSELYSRLNQKNEFAENRRISFDEILSWPLKQAQDFLGNFKVVIFFLPFYSNYEDRSDSEVAKVYSLLNSKFPITESNRKVFFLKGIRKQSSVDRKENVVDWGEDSLGGTGISVKTIYIGDVYGIFNVPDDENFVKLIIENRILGGILNVNDDLILLTFLDDLVDGLQKILTYQNINKLEVPDCFISTSIEAKLLVEQIHAYIPTAYGQVLFSRKKSILSKSPDIPAFSKFLGRPTAQLSGSLISIVTFHQSKEHADIKIHTDPEYFISKNETLVKRLFGSSASHLLLLESDEYQRFVRKVAVRGGVEGNGLPKLSGEIDFLGFLNSTNEFKTLNTLYPRVLDSIVTESYNKLDLEYIGDGKNVFTLLSEQDNCVANSYNTFLENLLSVIIPHGYLLHTSNNKIEKSLELLEDYYLRRAEVRIQYLRNISRFVLDFPSSTPTKLSRLADMRDLVINNSVCKHPLAIINAIRKDKKLLEMFRPRIEGFCAHGDLTFLNMVFDRESEKFRLIDSRGYIGGWDPLYDFGKLKFTISGFGKIINREYEVNEDDGKYHISFTGNKNGLAHLSKINKSFLNDVNQNQYFQLLTENEPYWKQRILFAEAIHYLADIPYRLLLDGSPKAAIGTFLLGTKYLNEVYMNTKQNTL